MKIDIDYTPKEIGVGTVVQLTAPAPSADHTYRYTWMVNGSPLESVSPEAGICTCQWDTTDLKPGAYKIGVTAKLDPPNQTNVPPGAKQADGEVVLSVQPQSVSSYDIERLATGAKEFARDLKHNFDGKMDQLTCNVASIAGGIGEVAQKMPDPDRASKVMLQRPQFLTDDLRSLAAFFSAVRNRTDAIRFGRYNEFINRLLCTGTDKGSAACSQSQSEPDSYPKSADSFGMPSIRDRRAELEARPSIYGVDAYNLLKTATEAFLIFETGIVVKPAKDAKTGLLGTRDANGDFIPAKPTDEVPGESSRLGESVTFQDITERLGKYLPNGKLPYLANIVTALIGLDVNRTEEKLPYCDGILRNRFSCPGLIELIWSYWHEEAMLVQTINAITLRFQNRRGSSGKDPLAHLEIDALHPLNNLLWGYIQDEMHRLTLPRRAYEYDHHYGLTIYGKAVPNLRSADSRSKFLEAFHNLLYRTSVFYHEDADMTVIADAFPLLNALREVHLLLAEGAHNQFGDLPWTARGEMLIQQWLLSRPEMREFLRGRAMVPYAETWMGQVDTMKRLQGWSETSVTNFFELGTFGEQILLSIRYHDWSVINNQDEARLWAQSFKPEIQRYIHSYRAVTGVDLTNEPVDASLPWVHLRNRLAEEQRRRAGR